MKDESAAELRHLTQIPRVHAAGAGGLYFDCSGANIDSAIQQRIWAMARALRTEARKPGMREIVPGVNNLLVLFDPLRLHPEVARAHVLELWHSIVPDEFVGKQVDIPVIYGGAGGCDLLDLAERAQLSVLDYVERHSQASYQVMCIGSTPGFGYMSGLPKQLHAPRRGSPRLKIPAGAVMIGGVQAGIMPNDAPSGWHILGHTSVVLFDPCRSNPCLFDPGDSVRYVVQGILA